MLSDRYAVCPVCLSVTLVYCGQTAEWMPLGTEVGLGPGNIVLDGDPAPLPKKGGGQQPLPQFSAHVLWPNGWMDQVCCGQTVAHLSYC